jgi:hypothetical protein
MWLVHELELPHEQIEAGSYFGRLDAPEFIAMNPHRHIPVIDDGGKTIWNHTPSCVISLLVTETDNSGPTTRMNDHFSSGGWIGRKPHCNLIF